jgi:hypothetical protein
MSGSYVIARENFKEAEKHVSAANEPVMFNLLYGLLSLTDQIEKDFAMLRDAVTALRPVPARRAKKTAAAPKIRRAAAKKPRGGRTAGTARNARKAQRSR